MIRPSKICPTAVNDLMFTLSQQSRQQDDALVLKLKQTENKSTIMTLLVFSRFVNRSLQLNLSTFMTATVSTASWVLVSLSWCIFRASRAYFRFKFRSLPTFLLNAISMNYTFTSAFSLPRNASRNYSL